MHKIFLYQLHHVNKLMSVDLHYGVIVALYTGRNHTVWNLEN